MKRTRELLPVVFIISASDRRRHECVNRIADMLQRNGYRLGKLTIVQPGLTSSQQRRGLTKRKTFLVYLPPGAAPVPRRAR